MWRTIGFCLLGALALAGCKPRAAELFGAPADHGHGRYAGIGIYSPSQPWTRMVAAKQAKETPAAKTVDDQAIIVVVDSRTGEVRSCGDLTGFCIGMNPWKTPLAAGQIAPVQLTQHLRPQETGPFTAAEADVSDAPPSR